MPLNSQFQKLGNEEDTYVLFENDFSTGMEGWGGLLASGMNYYPSLHSASLTGPHSLVIDTRGGTQNVEASASKRLPAFEGLWIIKARIAWNTHTTTVGTNALDKLRIALDWQRGTDRRWWELQYLHYSEGTSSHYPRWRVSNGNAGTMNLITELSEASAGDGNGYELGYNAINKFDFHDIELRLTAHATRAAWGSIRINDQIVDLRAMDANAVQTAETEFVNGGNLLFLVENRPTEANADPFMLVDYVRVEWGGLR